MTDASPLFQPYRLGSLALPNRIAMAPLTRNRAAPGTDAPHALTAEYYAQRASAGLLITEASQISQQGQGYVWTAARTLRALGETVVALGREGRLAAHSLNEGRRLWAAWVAAHAERFLAVLQPGERLVGEWLALAHGTRYALGHEPFVCFDLMRGAERLPWAGLTARVRPGGFVTAGLLHEGGPLSVEAALARLGDAGLHGAREGAEGAVWRLERRERGGARVELLAKYVRPGKRDGLLLPENSGREAVWNWRPGA